MMQSVGLQTKKSRCDRLTQAEEEEEKENIFNLFVSTGDLYNNSDKRRCMRVERNGSAAALRTVR